MVKTRAGRVAIPLDRLDDEQLAALAGEGHADAFDLLYRRHEPVLSAFCRRRLGREDGEDALQETFLRAHRALAATGSPRAVRPWLFAIARNRCLTVLAARGEPAVPIGQDTAPGVDDVADRVGLRAELDEVLGDLAALPGDQRRALVLAELGDLSQAEVACAIGCRPGKVKALVFQARAALIAERDARDIPCVEIHRLLATVKGGALRRGPLRRHLRSCPGCRTHRLAAPRRGALATVAA